MTRRHLLGLVAVVAAGALVVRQLEGMTRVVAWEVVLVLGAGAVVAGGGPGRLRKVPALFGGGREVPARPPRPLASLELELAAAVDPTLAGDRPLRHRLLGLLAHRAGAPEVGTEEGERLMGEEAWACLGREGRLSLEEVETLVERIERV